ncbi:MAG TPA: PepSY domain-containing protein [Thermoanaerobaculia bacterium]
MQFNRTLIIVCLTGSLATAGSLFAAEPQDKAPSQDTAAPAATAKKARISIEEARVIALAKVPTGTVRSEELNRENDKVAYSFEILVPGKKGIQVVRVNPADGEIVSIKEKSAWADRRDEAAKRRREAKKNN